jgi:hypothetical protein
MSSDNNKGLAQSIQVNGLTWAKTLMICAILVCAGVAAYFGANVSVNMSLDARVSAMENRMDIPVNSTLSAFIKSNSFIVSQLDQGFCLQNGTNAAYLPPFTINSSLIIENGLANASNNGGGSVYVAAGANLYNASVVVLNNTRLVLESGAKNITYSCAANAYAIVDDFQNWIFIYYSNGLPYSVFNYATGNLLTQSANMTSLYCTTIDQLTAGQGIKVLNLIVQSGISFPPSSLDKQVFFRSDQGYLYINNSGPWIPIGAIPSTYPYANLTGVPNTFPYANLTGVPNTLPYANVTGTPDLTVYLFANGTRALTGDLNFTGSYGVYGAYWLNSTNISFNGQLLLNGQNKTDTIAYPIEPVAYIVDFSDGITARVKNCTTGQVDYQNSNQTLAIQYAFNHTDWTGAHGTQKVVLRGNFSLNYYPNVPAYSDIEIQGYLNVSNKAAFMLGFDDSLAIQYSTYFKNMTTIWGYRGDQGVVVDWVSHAGATNTTYSTLANLKEMRDAGWSFYSHGWYSIDLSAASITLLQQDQEIRGSKDWIERNLGIRVDAIGWPSAKQGDLEMARQYYNYLAYGNWKSWPNQTWNYISDVMSCYFPDENNWNGSKTAGGVIASAAWYAVNSTGSGSNGELAILTFHGTMTNTVFNQCMGNLSSFGLPVLTWRDIDYYLSKQPKPTIAGADIALRNEGNQTACVNGTWIKHNLGVIPNSTSLLLLGPAYVNSTCWVIQPNIIASNSTFFQIEFLINNAGTVTPVAATDNRTIYWTCYYEKIIIYPAQT